MAILTAMGSNKNLNELRWELKHDSYRNCWKRPVKNFKGNATSIYHLDEMENLPFRKGENRFMGYKNAVNLSLFPISQFLARQVGRDYDDIFSEIKKRIPEKYRSKVDFSNWYFNKTKRLSETHEKVELFNYYYRNKGLFIDVRSNVLCYRQPHRRTRNTYVEDTTKPVYRPFKQAFFQFGKHQERFEFHQLTTYIDFEKEAKKMRHCIRSYYRICTKLEDKVSIWSLTIGKQKILTVQLSKGSIVQVKGERNRSPTKEEGELIKRFAQQIGYRITDVFLANY